MKYSLRIIGLLSLILAATGCKNAKSSKTLLPNVSGKAGEIIVVIDKDNWEGAVGTSIRDLLASDCPYLAQREPLFTLANVPPGSFTNMFKVHRNILILNIDPQGTKEGMVYQSDKWAHPQSVAQINAFTAEGAVAVLNADAALLCEYFEQAERNRVIANSIKRAATGSARRRRISSGSPMKSSTRTRRCCSTNTPWRGLQSPFRCRTSSRSGTRS